MTKKINILLEDDDDSREVQEKIKSLKSVLLEKAKLFSLVPPGKTGPALSGWFESGGLLYLHSGNVKKAVNTLTAVDEKDIDEALEKLKKYKNILTSMKAGTWNNKLGELASKTLYKRGGHGAAAMIAVNEAIGSLEGRKEGEASTETAGYEQPEVEPEDPGAKALDASKADEPDESGEDTPEASYLSDTEMKRAVDEIAKAARDEAYPGFAWNKKWGGNNDRDRVTNYIWLIVLGKDNTKKIKAENGNFKGASKDWLAIQSAAGKAGLDTADISPKERKAQDRVVKRDAAKKAGSSKKKSVKTDYGDPSGSKWSWKPRGQEQYLQFYKDLKAAGLLGKLFSGGKIRTKGKGGTGKVQLDESDGLDFSWGPKHRAAYAALLDKVKGSGHKSIEDWRKAGGKAAGGAGEAQSGEGIVSMTDIDGWNQKRQSRGLGPIDQKYYKYIKTAISNKTRNRDGQLEFDPNTGLFASEASGGQGGSSAGAVTTGASRTRTTAHKRKVAGSMLAKDVRSLQAAIDDSGSKANAKIKQIIMKYAQGGEHEGTGVPRTLTQLYTRFQKFTNVNLIQALQNDKEPKLAKIVRYGLQGLESGEGDSKGVLRRGGQDKQYDADLEDDAERLIRMGPDKTGTDEDGIEAILNKNARNLVALAKAYRQLAKDDPRVDDDAKTLIDMIEDEMGDDLGLARKVQTALQRQAQTLGESKMSKLRKLRKLFKEEFTKKIAEQTVGGMTTAAGKSIGGRTLDPNFADEEMSRIQAMIDEPHPSTEEEPPPSTSGRGLKYSGPQKAFMKYIRGLRNKGKLSRAQEKKLRRAVFSRKYKPRDTKGVEITKLINSEVVKKMNLDQRVNKPIAGVEKALSGQRASLDDLKASLARAQSAPNAGSKEMRRKISRIKRMIARAEQRGPDVDVMQIAKTAPDLIGKTKSLEDLRASLAKMKSAPNASSKEMQRAIARAERMIARKSAGKPATQDVDVMQIARTALDDLSKSKTVAEMEASLAKMKSAPNASSKEMKAAIARGERMLARKRRSERPSIQTATDLP